MSERELKLSIAADDLGRARAALLAMAGRPKPTRQKLTSRYFDTEDDVLRRHELMLRVRRRGRQYIQTVKARDLTGVDLIERSEWEDTIARPHPDLDAPNSGAKVRDLIGSDPLVELFTTVVERAIFPLSPRQGSVIEVGIDRGEIRAGDKSTPLHEIELELKEGDPIVLWDVALRLLEIVPCRIETRSKADRGYRLVRGAALKAPVLQPPPVPLDREMTVDEALHRAGRQFLAALARNEEAALEEVPEGVHQMRISVRRMRAVLSAVRRMLPEEHYQWANGELKWLGNALAPARDWDVFAEGLLQPVNGAVSGNGGLARLANAARRERRSAYDEAREAILSPRYTQALMRLSRWFEARGWRDQPVNERSAALMAPLGKVASDLLQRMHKQGLKRSRNFASLDPPERHRLRIALKKLRYAVEFLEPIYQRRNVARYLARLKPLQDDLGHANDVRAAEGLVAGIGEGEGALERAGGVVLGWHDRGLADTEAQTRKHVRRFRRAKPFW
jgi:triphosphatase